jgi:hypothetical protein
MSKRVCCTRPLHRSLQREDYTLRLTTPLLLSLALTAVFGFRCKALASALPDLYATCPEIIRAFVPRCVLVEHTLLWAQRGYPSSIGTCSTRVLGTNSLVTYEAIDFAEADTIGQAFRGGTAALREKGVGIAWFVGAWPAIGKIARICTRR